MGAACEATENLTIEQAVARVSPDRIRSHVGVLAHDSMRGRDTDDVGFEMARDYVASEFARLGLEPIDGDSYLQPFELLQVESDQGSRVTVGAAVFEYPDLIAAPNWLGDRPSLAAEGVYVGHDLVTGGVDVVGDQLVGKIAFVLAGVPEGRAEEPTIAMRERAEVELAYRAGAVGVVVLSPSMGEASWSARTGSTRPTRVLLDGTTPTPRPTVTMGPAASTQILATLEGPTVGAVTVEPQHEIGRIRSWNVGAILAGWDSDRGSEAVVFTAHLDHVGIGAPNSQGDSIYNGAHDNALGVAKLLEAAESLLGSRLPRSVLFLATGAEESGLLGSWHYVNHPVVPLSETVAVINHDGGLAAGDRTDDVFAWGPEFSTLQEDVEWAANETGLNLNPNKTAPFGPSAGLLYRSDHYPFLISGVPVAYLMPGFTSAGNPERGRDAWNAYLAGTHHAQPDNFDPSASYASPVALTALSIRLAWRLAHAAVFPQTHPDAAIRRTRGTPSGFFFGDSLRADSPTR
jgi:hypothetical protein